MINTDTLRVSVTDRCNLRCIYCMPAEGVPLIPHREVLTFEETERVVRAAVHCGVTKVRITGGEPLVRKDVLHLIRKLARVPGIQDLPLTTNGVLLARLARDLKESGLTRVTVSMDTTRPERFEQITRRPFMQKVMQGVRAALDHGLTPIKVNAVIVPEVNDDEVMDFVAFAKELDVEARFIERMPIIDRRLHPHCGISADSYIPSDVLKERIEDEEGALSQVETAAGSTARVYELPGGRGRVGFIAPLSHPFCEQCKRMRLTPDGKLRVCLAEGTELDVKGPLRRGASDHELADLYKKAVELKPHKKAACFSPTNRTMSQIGG